MTLFDQPDIAAVQASTGLVLPSVSRRMRPVMSANSIFIGMEMPLKARIGTTTCSAGKVEDSDREADPDITHGGADREYFTVAGLRPTQQPADSPRTEDQGNNRHDPPRPMDLSAGILYLPAASAAMMKSTIDSTPKAGQALAR